MLFPLAPIGFLLYIGLFELASELSAGVLSAWVLSRSDILVFFFPFESDSLFFLFKDVTTSDSPSSSLMTLGDPLSRSDSSSGCLG